jgi:hypothetical protein
MGSADAKRQAELLFQQRTVAEIREVWEKKPFPSVRVTCKHHSVCASRASAPLFPMTD